MVVVVLPTPPFWLHIAMIRAGPWAASGAGSGKTGIGRPVGPSWPAPAASVPGRWPVSRSEPPRVVSGDASWVVTSDSTGVSLPVSWRSSVSLALIGTTLSAGTGVALGIHLTQPLHRDQRVDLGRRDRGVAEQLLHDAHVRPSVEQVGGERVPQRVGREVSVEAGPLGGCPQHGPRRLARQPPAPLVEEHCGSALPLRREG